jgi:hypothetical protein
VITLRGTVSLITAGPGQLSLATLVQHLKSRCDARPCFLMAV